MQFWVKYMNNTNDILDRQAIYTRKYSLFDLIHTFMSIEGLQSLTGVSQVTCNCNSFYFFILGFIWCNLVLFGITWFLFVKTIFPKKMQFIAFNSIKKFAYTF